tara:strand:- start:126 stop:608 length:483 start_codon:yes stop_codon:yes gene_type:complete
MKKTSYLLLIIIYVLTSCKENVKAQEDEANKFNNTKATSAESYFNRGMSKDELKYSRSTKGNIIFNKGAIADYTKAIEIKPDYAEAFFNRGNSKYDLKDLKGAIADFTKTIEINPYHSPSYVRRGLSKFFLGNNYGACQDLRKAQDLGYDATDFIKRVCK